MERVLPFVHADGEAELRAAFEQTMRARSSGGDAKDVADRWFFETAVRVHRSGEGAPFTGLKPSGLDVGPVIPVAEHTIATGDPSPLIDLLVEELRIQIMQRFETIHQARAAADLDGSITAERAYVDAVLGLEVWAHHLHQRIVGPPHAAN